MMHAAVTPMRPNAIKKIISHILKVGGTFIANDADLSEISVRVGNVTYYFDDSGAVVDAVE